MRTEPIEMPSEAHSTQNLLDDVQYLSVALYGDGATIRDQFDRRDNTYRVFVYRSDGLPVHYGRCDTLPGALVEVMDQLRRRATIVNRILWEESK